MVLVWQLDADVMLLAYLIYVGPLLSNDIGVVLDINGQYFCVTTELLEKQREREREREREWVGGIQKGKKNVCDRLL